MKLRDHPALKTFGIPAWPPVWLHTRTEPYDRVIGEVGVFTGAVFYDHTPKRLFLRMELQGLSYVGCLVVSDRVICRELHRILEQHVGKTMEEIGDLDLTATL